MKTLSLIVPIYNEEKTLKDSILEVLKLEKQEYLIQNNIKLELVLVDDCSSDSSKKIAQELEKEYENIKFTSNEKNLGKGGALKNGFLIASGDFIGIQDADREYNPLEYVKLLKLMIEENADVVYGSRYLLRETRRVLYFWHTYMNKFLTFLTNMYTDLNITDMETCYKLFKKDVIKSIAPKLKENRFGFEPEVTMYVAKGKYKVYECAINYNPRTYEEGKKIKAKDGLRALYCIFHYGANTAPLPMQFLIYIFIGGFSALINIIAFLILVNFINDLRVNIAISFVLSALVNYLLCIALLFRHKARWSSLGELFTYFLTLAIMGYLDYFVTNSLLIFGLNNFISKSLASFVGLIGNFLLRKYFVFPEKRKQQ